MEATALPRMIPSEKDLFAVEFRNIPDKGIFLKGGLKFRSDESETRRRYKPLLRRVPLEILLGEAALWVLWPSTAAIWIFPLLLLRLRIDIAVLVDIGIFFAVQIADMLFYSRTFNYVGFILANRALQALLYAMWGVWLWFSGGPAKVLALGAWLLLMATGVVQVVFTVPFLPLLTRVFSKLPADQALWRVACVRAREAGIPLDQLESPGVRN